VQQIFPQKVSKLVCYSSQRHYRPQTWYKLFRKL